MSAVHATDAVSVVEGAGGQEWQPALGALPILSNPYFGLSSGIIVDLATGNLTYLPKEDLSGHNGSGSDAAFTRSYRSELVPRGYGSPGLPVGWVHGWDVSLTPANPGDPKSPLVLTYPSGVTESVAPKVTPDGKLTGKIVPAGGCPYLIAGVPSATTPGVWERITVTCGNESRWTFTLATDGKTYVLRQIDDLLLDWDDSRRIRAARIPSTASCSCLPTIPRRGCSRRLPTGASGPWRTCTRLRLPAPVWETRRV